MFPEFFSQLCSVFEKKLNPLMWSRNIELMDFLRKIEQDAEKIVETRKFYFY